MSGAGFPFSMSSPPSLTGKASVNPITDSFRSTHSRSDDDATAMGNPRRCASAISSRTPGRATRSERSTSLTTSL